MKMCPYHNEPGDRCSCYCKGCGNSHVDCICRFMDGVFEDEVGPPDSRSIMDLSSYFNRGDK